MTRFISLDRRAFLGGGAALVAAAGLQPSWARTVSHGVAAKAQGTLSGENIRMIVADTGFSVDGRQGHAVAINGTIPAPLLRLKEGQNVRITVENHRVRNAPRIQQRHKLVPAIVGRIRRDENELQ